MINTISRRQFAVGAASAAAALALPRRALAAGSHFKIGVISDEISQDFDHACYVINKEFGLHYVELREIFGKNLQQVPDDHLAQAEKIINKYGLTVTDIASPLYKVDWPGAPSSLYSTPADRHGSPESNFKEQDGVLERSIALAKRFGTNKVRCFDFWRLDDIAPHRKAINDVLKQAAEKSAKQKVQLVLENEYACNTATGREAAATLAGVPSGNFFMNWDPANAVMRGELDAYPGGWNTLPKARIHHCHVKNAAKDASGKMQWSPVDIGFIDWTAQFRALKEMGYSYATNLETHWTGGGTPEVSTRISWAGMKKCLEAAGAI